MEYVSKRAKFFLAGMKEQRDVGGGRILLGGNRGGGAVTLRPIGSQCVGVWISTVHSSLYVQSQPSVHPVPTFAGPSGT